jgi:AAA15 family ATPase/GTPase
MIEIENFKLFKKFQINNLSRVNLVAGKNNSGKSTLLEAIWLFFGRHLTTSPFVTTHIGRGMDVWEVNDSLWMPLFNDFDLKRTLMINVIEDNINKNLKLKIEFNKSKSYTEMPGQSKSDGVFPANVHPLILHYKDDLLRACSEMKLCIRKRPPAY